jgi:gluconate 2-dehydrogenase subunit 3-like protein
MKRRTALQVVSAAIAPGEFAIAQHHLITLAQAPESYKPRFFNPEQIALLSQLTEMIIPADDHSPGAKEAQVSLFVDLIVAHSAPDVQERWKSGLKLVETEAQKRADKPFLKCSAAEQDSILAAMAAGEADPTTELERFFALLKLMTIDGYYTSSIGIHRELRYKGNAVLARFPGCSHSDH